MDLLEDDYIAGLVLNALKEDIGDGDCTTEALIDPAWEGEAFVVFREAGVLSGLALVEQVYRALDTAVFCESVKKDGDSVQAGETVARLQGGLGALLTGERVALNFLQQLSGVATLTQQFVERVQPHEVMILDTRKTLPGWRALQKYAIQCGGGVNHRMGLYDRVMIKDNHLAWWTKETGKPIAAAIAEARKVNPDKVIQVEADTLEQVRDFVGLRPDWILLDNMSVETLREAVALCDGVCKTEASGGVSLGTIHEIAATGVDAISVGALTHSAPALDIALDVQ